MTTRQKMKADARRSADEAPKADPKTGSKALADAKAKTKSSKMPAQPVYKTQTEDIAGDNVHRDTDKIISEFDDPAANTVKPD